MDVDQQRVQTSFCYRCKNAVCACKFSLLLCSAFLTAAALVAIIYNGLGPMRSKRRTQCIECYCNNTDEFTNRIYGNIEKYPFVGALISKKPYFFLCTCIILNGRYLLTAAHCFNVNLPYLSVRVGSEFWNHNGLEYNISKFIIHNNFNEKTMENNAALIFTEKIIVMSKIVDSAKIINRFISPKELEKAIVLGWSTSAITDRQTTRLLQQEFIIWKPLQCAHYTEKLNSSKFICASLANNSCSLDVHGLLIVNGTIVGLWSWGPSCYFNPSIFSHIYYLSPWFKNISNN